MATTKILDTVIIFLSLTRIIANRDLKCKYDLIKENNTNEALTFDALLSYVLYESQNGCVINVDEIYKNTTKMLEENGTQILVYIRFICVPSAEGNDIHLKVSETDRKTDDLETNVGIMLQDCSLFMDELSSLQKLGHIWSLVISNTSYIHPGVSCTSLKYLTTLTLTLMCAENNDNKIQTFFLEPCDPLDKLFTLELEGCSKNLYDLKQADIQNKFPNLQSLKLKYMNLSSSEIIFPWTNPFIDQSYINLINSVANLKFNESEIRNKYYFVTIEISDSKVNFGSDLILIGQIFEISFKNVEISKLDTIFMNVSGLMNLVLSHNEIQEVDRHAFLMQTALTRLTLANNKLMTLPDELFDSLNNLEDLNLSSNKIIEIKQRHLKNLFQLRELILDNNEITTLPLDFLGSQINSIQYVSLSENPLKTLPLNVVYAPKLLLVEMRHCQINSNGLLSLLNHINITAAKNVYLQSQDFFPSQLTFPVRKIDLLKNKITGLPVKYMSSNAVLALQAVIQAFYIDLKDNPIDCTCNITLAVMVASMYQGFSVDWTCQYPQEFKGRLITSIEPDETYCQIDSKYCPVQCNCFERHGNSSKKTFIIDCHNTNITYMPLALPSGQLELRFRNAGLYEISTRDYLKNIISLDVSGNKIDQISKATAIALSKVSILKLDNNKLTLLPEVLAKRNMSFVTLSRNPFICDCNIKWMKPWLLNETNPVIDWREIDCTYNTHKVGQIVSLPDSVFVCKGHSDNFHFHKHVIFPSIIIGSVLFVLVSISLLVIFNRFTIKVLLFLYCGFRLFNKRNKCQKNATYDAFVLCSYADRACIQIDLIDRLKGKGFRVVDFHNDLIIGFSFLQNINIFLKKSKRVVFCWTDDMVSNDLMLSAWNMAYERAVKHDLDLLILVVDSHLDKRSLTNETLKDFLKQGRYIKRRAKYMFASVEYLMPRLNSNFENNSTVVDEMGENGSDIPMLAKVSDTMNDHGNDLIYISYADDLDIEIRNELIPSLARKGLNIKIFEHEFTPGEDIREEIHNKLTSSKHFIFVVSDSIFDDDVKIFILMTVMSESILRDNNYLLLFTSSYSYESDGTNELKKYFNNFVTGSIRDVNFKIHLLKALQDSD